MTGYDGEVRKLTNDNGKRAKNQEGDNTRKMRLAHGKMTRRSDGHPKKVLTERC